MRTTPSKEMEIIKAPITITISFNNHSNCMNKSTSQIKQSRQRGMRIVGITFRIIFPADKIKKTNLKNIDKPISIHRLYQDQTFKAEDHTLTGHSLIKTACYRPPVWLLIEI